MSKRLLYHYCSNATWLEIIKSKKIWLSSLIQSNDHLEGKYIAKVVGDLTAQLSPVEGSEPLTHFLNYIADQTDNFGLCLSANGNQLSQWRGYAQDGTGISIGFSEAELNHLADSANFLTDQYEGSNLSLFKICYDPEEQKRQLKPLLRAYSENAFFEIIDNEVSPFRFKHPAFMEEEEWRLVLNCPRESTLIARGGSTELNIMKLNHHYKARATGNEIKIHVEMSLRPRLHYPEVLNHYPEVIQSFDPIRKVILGPKNATPISLIETILLAEGWGNVEVEKSDAPYR